VEGTAQRILDGVLAIHTEIVRQAENYRETRPWVLKMMADEGFVFDFVIQKMKRYS
jgi:hypothetical protein